MPNIIITSLINLPCPGLASKKSLLALSEKRITTTAREILRGRYGQQITVSCFAQRTHQGWYGKCVIDNLSYDYEIM